MLDRSAQVSFLLQCRAKLYSSKVRDKNSVESSLPRLPATPRGRWLPSRTPRRSQNHAVQEKSQDDVVLRLLHAQVVGNRKGSGDTLGANTYQVLVSLAVNHALQRYPPHVHDNPDRLLHSQCVLL